MKELQPKTLAQYQAEANRSPADGSWACPRCGCKRTQVEDSRFVSGDPRFAGYAKRRVRVCGNCKHIVSSGRGTLEVDVPDGCRLLVVPEDERAIA